VSYKLGMEEIGPALMRFEGYGREIRKGTSHTKGADILHIPNQTGEGRSTTPRHL